MSLHAQDFFKNYLEPGGEFDGEKFYIMRGEQNITSTPWVDPVGEEAKFGAYNVSKQRTIKMDCQIKGNPFVKVAPTTRVLRIVENTENKILLKIMTITNNVPYCDCFGVEEEWLIASLPGTKCCVFRVALVIRWFKSTMMKSIIKSSTDGEAGKTCAAFRQWLIDNGH